MKVVADKSIKNFLVDFGLTDKEITIYLTLLKTGPNTIMNLARETAIKRSTTHNTVEELIKKGLISQTNYGERRMVVAEDPDKLRFLMEQKKWDIGKMEKNLPDIITNIYQVVPSAKENSKLDVKYYMGEKEVKYVYDLSMKSKIVYSFADLEKYYKLYPNGLDDWKSAFSKNKDREMWDLLIDSSKAREIVNKADKRYHTKFIPDTSFFEGFEFTDYLIFNDNVAIIDLNPETPSATLISSKAIANSLIGLHKTMWSLIK